ncbi:unnamed protein product [Echinostoma caproni]|uniref:Protein kinase domain-containing protein n=1 Tax=Echinostoma caproni TaxID=27848 RepID=A0A183BFL6_9TREM|nr:unnamed protein product [Echinostoma caproni]
MRELQIVQICSSCDRIVEVHDYHIGQLDVTLIFENAAGGDLYHIINDSEFNLPFTVVQSAVLQLLRAVSFLHMRSVVHLDIKVYLSVKI